MKAITDNEAMMVICAVRYCLPRQTYVTGICTEWLSGIWDQLPYTTQAVIVRDIVEALQDEAAGSPTIDAPKWKELASNFFACDGFNRKWVRDAVAHRNKPWPLTEKENA